MSWKRLSLFALCGLVALSAASARATVIINEMLISTESTDREFIELYNSGLAPVDISGWFIELYDSDSGGTFGGVDGSSPHTVPAATILAAGDFYTMINATAAAGYSVTGDQVLPANGLENGSFTAILNDASDVDIEIVFVTDGGATDSANDAGVAVTPDFTVGPDGTFLPAGVYRTTDGGSSWGFLNFNYADQNNGTPEGGTPDGTNEIPEPASMILMFAGLTAICATRRKL